jgi:hypothetical protein
MKKKKRDWTYGPIKSSTKTALTGAPLGLASLDSKDELLLAMTTHGMSSGRKLRLARYRRVSVVRKGDR